LEEEPVEGRKKTYGFKTKIQTLADSWHIGTSGFGRFSVRF
jgi:hypothetical protein